MALWSVVHSGHSDNIQDARLHKIDTVDCGSVDDPMVGLAECVPVMRPIFHFSNISTDSCSLTSAGERVRGLAYNDHNYELASLQANQCAASLHFWDVFLFQQVRSFSPCVCSGLVVRPPHVCAQVRDSMSLLMCVLKLGLA